MGLDTSLIQHGGVASDNALCSGIGIDMYRRGGNAADAVCSFPVSFIIDGAHFTPDGSHCIVQWCCRYVSKEQLRQN
jgi:hypothetical protein